MNDTLHNPDVLSCLANLSNDEVFTPPKVVNDMLDLLPPELFKSKTTTFLDIGCKSGVFLREIAKRLIVGLADEIPDLQERVDHILHKQLFGIATTELTSLVSRRTLYCSKYPNCVYSASRFETPEGNIRFRNVPHAFVNGRCKWCGASEDQFGDKARQDLETHAYEFIHTAHPEEIFKMKFDVIVGNPPYQLETAGDDNGAQAKPIYHKFVEQAIRLNPRYLIMITPSRWFTGGWGLDEFRDNMLNDQHVREIHDYPDASECFPGVEIKGGVSYFLWSSIGNGVCNFVIHKAGAILSQMARPLKEPGCNILIRYNEAVPILRKVREWGEQTFDILVSTKKPFGFTTNYHGHGTALKNSVKLYANHRTEFVFRGDVSRNADVVDKHKLIIPKAVGSGDPATDEIKPLYSEPGSCCTETYLLVGPFRSKRECDNVACYISTRFFHFLVTLQKNTQDCMKKVYSFVPLQDFSKPWTDAELYAKYNLTKDEIAFIESMIKPME